MATNTKNPEKIKLLKEIIKDSCSTYAIDNTSIIFKSIDDLLLIVYTNKDKSLICYNIINDKKANEVFNAHSSTITNLRHYPDEYNRIHYILSVSMDDNNLKLWNVRNFVCLYDFKNVNKTGWINSAYFINDHNQIYILTSNCGGFNKTPDPIKVLGLEGKKIKEINESKENTYFIDSYYNKYLSINYIITGNIGCYRSYDYNNNKPYKIYNDGSDRFHISAVILQKGDVLNLIGSSEVGNISIWDFNSGELLNTIKINNGHLYGICLWDDNYLMAGSEEKSIKIIDLNKKEVVSSLNETINNDVLTIKKLDHPQYGEILVSQGHREDGFKLWGYKN